MEGSENISVNACMFLIAEPLFFSQLCNLSDGIAFLLLGKLRNKSYVGKDFCKSVDNL